MLMLMTSPSPCADLWHIGELPGDSGLAIRDGSGILVAVGDDPVATATAVHDHNLREVGRMVEGREIGEARAAAYLVDLCEFSEMEAIRYARCLFQGRPRLN